MEERGEPYRDNKYRRMKYRYFAVSLLNKFPVLKQLAVRIYGSLTILRYKQRTKRITQRHGGEFDVSKVYWLNPEKIVYCSLEEFNIYKYNAETIPGDWDRLGKKFEDLDMFIAFKERFVNGKNWDDTAYYQRYLAEITEGNLPGGCKTKSDLDKRCQCFELLYQNIKDKGYKSQSELMAEKNDDNPVLTDDEISVNVGREGDLLFNNGAHRLAIVKVLGLETIPCKITVRHPEWVSFRKQILLYAEEHRGKIYQPLTHPDLQKIPSFHGDDRFNIIENNLSAKKGHLLDIGAHWGYFCHKFEECGFDCYAVENDELTLYFLKKLKRAENRRFKIITKSILRWPDIKNLHFDVVLALNIFYHFLKEEGSYLELIRFLKNLKMKEMYFQPHLPTELQGEDVYQNYGEDEFVEFIMQNSKLNNVKLLGEDTDGRKIFKLW